MKNYKKEYYKLTGKIITLRQLVGEGLKDVDIIYKELHNIVPFFDKENERKMKESIKDLMKQMK